MSQEKIPDTLYLSVSGLIIKVHFRRTPRVFIKEKIKKEIFEFYQGFIINQKPREVVYTIEFIDRKWVHILYRTPKERVSFMSSYEEKGKEKIVTFYVISIFQFQLILKVIMRNLLAKYDAFTLHSSAIKYYNKAVQFIGGSGAGKSTVMKILSGKYTPLSDDTSIIRKENNNFYFYQAPFIEGEWWLKRNSKKYLIGPILFLRKGNSCKISIIKNKEIIIQEIIKGFSLQDRKHFEQQAKQIINFIDNYDYFYFFYFTKNKKRVIEDLEVFLRAHPLQ